MAKRKNPYRTLQEINRSLRVLWEFNFHNVNKETKEQGPPQKIIVAVRASWGGGEIRGPGRKGGYRSADDMKKLAVNKFTAIVNYMYPKADQIVSDYGPVNAGRIFV